MPKLEVLDEIMRKNMLMWPCLEHDDAPWTPMSKPLSESKVALVTTAGLHAVSYTHLTLPTILLV